MALRRRAMNNASVGTPGPVTPQAADGSASPAGSPLPALSLPHTSRPRASIFVDRSPAATSSISANVAFDWEAARARKPAPYGTPQSRARQSMGGSGIQGTPTRRAVVRKKSFYQRVTGIPSQIAFHIAMFPSNVPLPKNQTSAFILGGALHFIHFCVRISQVRSVPDSEYGWEDMHLEGEGQSWFDWTVPMTVLLLAISSVNTLYLFSRIKMYWLYHRPDPVSSPSAKFIVTKLDDSPVVLAPLSKRVLRGLWFAFSVSWRFLLGMKPPMRSVPTSAGKPGTTRVQQLEMWNPGELELMLFTIYSPAHSFLWMATSTSNWMIMFFVMATVCGQAHLTVRVFQRLIKDKEIIAAEVLHEYNSGFVYPRINPVRKDVAVMTHQSEVVNVWED